MMSDKYIDRVEELLAHEGRTDVTEQYQETIEMFVEMAEHRSVPIPLAHIVAYEDNSNRDIVILLFIIDVNEDVFGDQIYSFEMAVQPEKLHAIEDVDHPVDAEMGSYTELLLEEYSRMLRTVQEKLWGDVVNLGGESDGDE